MTDLTARLRDHSRSEYGICTEAADEIEHLAPDLHTEQAAVVALQAEIAGLRESAARRVAHHESELAGMVMELEQALEGVARLKAARIHFSDIHSCGPTCTRAGCVAAGLRAEVAGLRAFIASDPWAITYQTLGQYRTALLRKIDGARKAAP